MRRRHESATAALPSLARLSNHDHAASLPLSLSLLLLLLPSPSTHAPSLPQKEGLLLPCALPVLIRHHSEQRESLNNAAAAAAAATLKGAQEQFSAGNNAASTVTMETNDGPLEGGGVGGDEGRWRGRGELSEGEQEGRADE